MADGLPPVEVKFAKPDKGFQVRVGSWRALGVGLLGLVVVCLWAWVSTWEPVTRRHEPHQTPLVVAVVGWGLLGIVGALLLVAVGVVAFKAVAWARREIHDYQHQKEQDHIDLERAKAAAEAEARRGRLDAAHLPPIYDGRIGAVVRQLPDGLWQVVNLDAEKAPVTMNGDGTVSRANDDDLLRAQLAANIALELERARAGAFPSLHTYQLRQVAPSAAQLSPAAEAQVAAWPDRVLLRDVAPPPVSLSRVVLGATFDKAGQREIVAAPLASLVHFIVGGSTGWGKSGWLRAFAFQLATAAEPCQLALIDLEAVTFEPFANADRLLWPLADTEAAAVAVARQLFAEMERRKRLYLEFPGVDNLAAYNAKAGDEPLSPIVCLIDEATVLLSGAEAHGVIRELTIRARKYGIWMVLGGQSWRTRDVDGGIRDMLQTRIHFKALAPSQSRVVLNDPCAVTIRNVGRAYAMIPGRPNLLELQAPWIEPDDIIAALAGQHGPANEMPAQEAAAADDGQDETDDEIDTRIRERHAQGWSLRRIENEVYGEIRGGSQYERIRRVVSAMGGNGNNGHEK